MLGRAAMENVAIFGNIDNKFYGEPNPCPNRRMALQIYCLYLDSIYPRRCSDGDHRISTVTFPLLVVEPEGCCRHCLDFHTGKPVVDRDQNLRKVSPKIYERSLKPVLSLFCGFPRQREFRRQLDRFRLKMYNCGPANVIRKAAQSVPDSILDENF